MAEGVNSSQMMQEQVSSYVGPQSGYSQQIPTYSVDLREFEELPSSTAGTVDLWQLCGDLLQEKSVKFRTLSESMLPQAPSGRLCSGALVFPGSRSSLNHVLFLSPLDDHRVMAVGYSKNLVFPGSEIKEVEATVDKLNETSPFGLWKMESKNGNCFPVLEAVVGPVTCGSAQGRSTRAKEFLWKCCGAVDVAFKISGVNFTEANSMEAKNIALRVKEFLEKIGFKKIKESTIPRGVSYLVVLSNDDEDETSLWKRFPMKIDVTEVLTFRIYFSLKDSAINATNGFISTSKRLITMINTQFPVGFYSYSSGTNQLQYTLKLNYQSLSTADLRTSLKAYYDASILYYKWSVRAFAMVHNRTSEGESVSDIWDAVELLGDELQGDMIWKKLEIEGSTEQYVSMLRKLEASPELAEYFLSHPFYRISESGQVLVKTSRRLMSFCSFIGRFETRRDELCQLLYELIAKLLGVGVFPTNDMLFCTNIHPFQLIVIPGVELYEDEKRCFVDFQEFMLNQSLSLKEIHNKLNSDLLKISSNSFENSTFVTLDHYMLVRSRLADEEFLLYHITVDARVLSFRLALLLYMSKLCKLPDYLNKVTGFTELYDENMPESFSQSSEGNFFLCEKYYLQFYGFSDHFASMLGFLEEVEKLHSAGFYHWFICPLTLRKGREKSEFKDRKQLVLPCLDYSFAELIYNCVKKPCKDYLAPEVKEFLQTRKAVANLFAADVYSFCKCLLTKAKIKDTSSLQSVEEIDANATLERGLSSKPESRPSLGEVKQAIQVFHNLQERAKKK